MFGEAYRAKSIVAAVTLCVISSQIAISEENITRSDREAINLFKQIIISDPEIYTVCSISDKWLIHAISEKTIKNYANYPVRDDLSPSDHLKRPKDIIRGSADVEPLVCSEKERAERKDTVLGSSTNSDNGTFRGRKIVASTKTLLNKFSYPIFDSEYKIAFLVQDSSSRIWIKTDDDKYPSFGDGEVAVIIYKKERGKWIFIGRDIYATYS